MTLPSYLRGRQKTVIERIAIKFKYFKGYYKLTRNFVLGIRTEGLPFLTEKKNETLAYL